MSDPTVHELNDAIQRFKLYVQQNFPFKQTMYAGDTIPTVSPGIAAPIGATYNQMFGNNLLKSWIKQTASDTGWIEDGSGGVSGAAGFVLWEPLTDYTSFSANSLPSLVWDTITQKFYYNLSDFTSASTFAGDLLLGRWQELGSGSGTNPMLPIGTWDPSSQIVLIPPASTIGATVTTVSDSDYILVPTGGVVPGQTMPSAFSAAEISLRQGHLWAQITFNDASEIDGCGFVLCNGAATLADVTQAVTDGRAFGSCTQAALIHVSPDNPSIVSVNLVVHDQASSARESLGVPLSAGEKFLFGLDTDTGDLLVQAETGTVLSLTDALSGLRLNIPTLEVANAKIGVFLILVSDITPSTSTHFCLSYTDSTHKPFSTAIPAALPVDVADGKRYIATGTGRYANTLVNIHDLVEFRNNTNDIVVTRSGIPGVLQTWDLYATTETTAAVPATTGGTATFVGIAPGPYTLIPAAGMTSQGWSIASSLGGVRKPSGLTNTNCFASLVWPDTSLDLDGDLQGVGFLLISDGSSVEDFLEYLSTNIAPRPMAAAAILVSATQMQYTTLSIDGLEVSGTQQFSSTLVAGQKFYMQYSTANTATGDIYAGPEGEGLAWLTTLPQLPILENLKIAAAAIYNPSYTVAIDTLPRVVFNFHETSDGRVGFHLDQTSLPVDAEPGNLYEATTGGTYLGKKIEQGSVVIVLQNGLDIAVAPYSTKPGGLQEGSSILLLSNPVGSQGYSSRGDTASLFSSHQYGGDYAHPLATQYTAGFLSPAEKAVIAGSRIPLTQQWRGSAISRQSLATAYADSLAYSPSLDTIVASKTQNATGISLMYSIDGGDNWTASNSFGTFSSSAGPVFWIEDLKRFFVVKGSPLYSSYWSTTGKDAWVPASGLDLSQVTSLAYSPSLKLAVVGGTKGGINQVFTSTNLEVWSQILLPTGTDNNGRRVVCRSEDLNLFIALPYSSSDPSAYSTDGQTWFDSTSTIPAGAWNACVWSSELRMFVAVGVIAGGYYPAIIISYDGKEWRIPTSITTSVPEDLNSIVWCPEAGVFLAVGASTSVWSADGELWSERSSYTSLGTTLKGRGVVWVPRHKKILAGKNSLMYETYPDTSELVGKRGTDLIRNDNPTAIGGLVSLRQGDVYTKRFLLTSNTVLSIPDSLIIPTGTSFTISLPPNYTLNINNGLGLNTGVINVIGSPAYATEAYVVKTGPLIWDVVYSSAQRNSITDLGNLSAYTLEIDLSLGEYFRVTLDSSPNTLAIIGRTPAGYAMRAFIEITQGANASTISWPSEFRWEGAAPSIPLTQGSVCILEITSVRDGIFWDATLSVRG